MNNQNPVHQSATLLPRVLTKESKHMFDAIKRFLTDEQGMQTGEYMILGTVMGAGSIGAIKTVRDGQVEKFQELSAALDTNTDGTIGGG